MVTQEEIRARIAALKDRVSRIRTVKYGDYVLSSDFNEVASCLAEAADILSKLPLTKEIIREVVRAIFGEIIKAEAEQVETVKIEIPPLPYSYVQSEQVEMVET